MLWHSMGKQQIVWVRLYTRRFHIQKTVTGTKCVCCDKMLENSKEVLVSPPIH